MKRQGMLAVVSGFSGAGKGTVMKALLEKYENYALSISATTRAPRPGEQDGREYFFMTDEQFEELIQNDRLIVCEPLLRDSQTLCGIQNGRGEGRDP